MRRALAAAADLVLRRRPLAALAVALAADAALPVDAPFALLALVPLYGIAAHRSWRTTAAGVAAVALAELVHLATWGSRGGLAAVAATTGLAVVVAAIARPCASAAGARRASRHCSPIARSPRSGCGSPASCTTRSGTRCR